MSTSISQRELRNDNAEIMRRVERGESFVVTRNGSPVADLTPYRPGTGRRRFVPVAEIAAGLGQLPEWGVENYLRERADFDRLVDDDDHDPWDRR